MDAPLSIQIDGAAAMAVGCLFLALWLVDRRMVENLLWAVFQWGLGLSEFTGRWTDRADVTVLDSFSSLISGITIVFLLAAVEAYAGRRVPIWRTSFFGLVLGLLITAVERGIGTLASDLGVFVLFLVSFIGGAGLLWRQSRLLARVIAVILVLRASQLVTLYWLSHAGALELYGPTGGLFNLALSCALLTATLGEYSRRVEGARQELADANERLTALAVDLERRTVEYAEARDRAEAASRAKSQFLANMSHELRTPLNAVIGYSELLQTADPPPEPIRMRDYAGSIEHAGRRLLAIVDEVLDLSRIDFGTIEIDRRPVPLADLVDGTVRMLALTAGEKQQRFEQVLPARVEALVDEQLLGQALLNIVGNAVKFTPPGGTVTISAERFGRSGLRIGVADTGPGIAPAQRAQVFERFWQQAPALTRAYEGLGLGLSIAKRLVELHGGTIDVDTAPGGGALFVIDLPDGSLTQSSLEPATL